MASRSPRAGSDPFPPTADPSAYVPRTATESVLLQLEMAAEDGARVMLLEGPPGSGRTLLLHVLARRLDGRFMSLHVPYSKFSPTELWQWLLAALNEPCASHPEVALRARISRDACDGFPPKLLMIDDAGWMPPDTVEHLFELQADYPDALRMLLVVPEAFSAARFERAGPVCERILLEGEMDAGEMDRYVRARLERSALDDEARRCLERALDELYHESAGNPGRLHAAATELLLRGVTPNESRTASRSRVSAQA